VLDAIRACDSLYGYNHREKAYKKEKKVVELSDKYSVSLEKMFQFRAGDTSKQRPVKRENVQVDSDSSEDLEPPKKKQKFNPLRGKTVWILIDNDATVVLNVYAEKEEAIQKQKELQKKQNDRESSKKKEYGVFSVVIQ